MEFEVTLNERSARAIHSAIAFTLNKWAGQEPIDQETLFMLKSEYQKLLLEFQFARET